MTRFLGFSEGKSRLVPIPGSFFHQLLPEIDHLNELRITLYAFWILDQSEGPFRYFQINQLTGADMLINSMGKTLQDAHTAIADGLARAVQRGTLLEVEVALQEGYRKLYFLNSPRGRAGVQAIQSGDWRPTENERLPVEIIKEKPNVFRLYEEHIGPLTPMIADTLKDAETNYSADWIEDAIRIAVENNVRRWSYIEAILKSWQTEGRDERQPGRDSEEDRHKYISGKYSEYIEH